MESMLGIIYYVLGAIIGCVVLSTDVKYSVIERRFRLYHAPAGLILGYLVVYSLVWLFVVGL